METVEKADDSRGLRFQQICVECGKKAAEWAGSGKKAKCSTCTEYYEGVGGGCPSCAKKNGNVCRGCGRAFAKRVV